MITAEDIIKKLNMKAHPMEGGFFIEMYKSAEGFTDEKYGERSFSTAIYFMITTRTFSEMHLLGIDEVYHFYLGDPVEMLNLKPGGSGERIIIGNDLEKDQRPLVTVPGDVWQGSRLLDGGGKYGFALMGTTMAPGFEFRDYQSGKKDELIPRFPQYKELIEALTNY